MIASKPVVNERWTVHFSRRRILAESRPGLLAEYLAREQRGEVQRFVSVQEAGERLGKSPRTIRNWCEWGRLHWVRIGRQIYVDASSLNSHILMPSDE